MALRCTQAIALGLVADVLNLNPFITDLEEYPPRPRPPDPAPLPPSMPRFPTGPSPLQSVGYTSLDAWWWTLLCRANTLADDTLLQQALNCRASFTQYARFAGGPGSLSLNFWYARFADRAYVGIQGTANDLQAMQYIMTHAVGDQRPVGVWYWNTTFYNQAGNIAQTVQPWFAGLGTNVPLAIIGHSYGGAVGHILFFNLRSTLTGAIPFDRIVSFGAPRVFTAAAARTWAGYGENLQLIRFANDGDIVPQLPPPLAALRQLTGLTSLGGFQGGDFNHIGPSVAMQDNGTVQARDNTNLVTADLLQQFAFYLNLAANPRPHTAEGYSDLARNWYGNSPLSVREGWANPNGLYSIHTDLDALDA